VAALPRFGTPVALLAQTTLSHRDWAEVAEATRERFPDMWTPGRSDLCFATTNRQSALLAIAERCDAVVVIGSANSSNTLALERLAREAGCATVVRVNAATELPRSTDGSVALHGVVGVTAGASAPEELVEEVLDALAPGPRRGGGARHRRGRVLPAARNLRDLLVAIEAAGSFGLGADPGSRPAPNDRAVPASAVLADLA